jgi:hypothetical protein
MFSINRRLGEQGFRWFVGLVEDNTTDSKKLGGCKVRAFGVHDEIATERLPDAIVMMPTTSGSFKGIGDTPSLIAGSFVFGFFLDGEEKKYPMILGTIPYEPDDEITNSIPFLARGKQTVVNTKIGPEPESSYAAQYPYNRVINTRAGHIVEIDDTPDNERLHVRHSKGSYVEINKDGRIIIKSVDDSFEIVGKDKTVYIEGNANIQVKGNLESIVEGDTIITGEGDIVLASEGTISINGFKGVNINTGTGIAAQCPGGLVMTEGSITTVGAISSAIGASDVFTVENGKTVHVSKGIITQIV